MIRLLCSMRGYDGYAGAIAKDKTKKIKQSFQLFSEKKFHCECGFKPERRSDFSTSICEHGHKLIFAVKGKKPTLHINLMCKITKHTIFNTTRMHTKHVQSELQINLCSQML